MTVITPRTGHAYEGGHQPATLASTGANPVPASTPTPKAIELPTIGMTGPELIDMIAADPSLDKFLDRDPFAVPYQEEELVKRVRIERANRAMLNLKSEAKRAKRQGVEEIQTQTEETDDDSEKG